MILKEVTLDYEKKEICKSILASLPEWFGIPESTAKYIEESADLTMFTIYDNYKAIGFVSIKINTQYTIEINVIGILPEYHKKGLGRTLVNHVLIWAKENSYHFIQVKTLDESHPDIHYAKTRNFYLSVGFKPLECIPEIWGEKCPCLVMIQSIN